MQATPDGIKNVIDEVDCEYSSNFTLLLESFEDSWPPSGWYEDPSNSRWWRDSSMAYDNIYSAQFRGQAMGRSGNLVTLDINTSTLSSFTIDFWYQDDDTNENQFLVEYWDGNQWDTIADLGSTTQEDQWLNYNDVVSETQYMISDFKVRWVCNSLSTEENIWVDLVTLKTITGALNYRCDLEVTWSYLNPDLTNEWLNIYCGNLDHEALNIDVWNGSQWVTIIYGVNSGWNTFNLTEHLLSSTFTLRFNDQIQSNDTTKSSWEIDSLFLSLWD
jgi:hypothetical protein